MYWVVVSSQGQIRQLDLGKGRFPSWREKGFSCLWVRSGGCTVTNDERAETRKILPCDKPVTGVDHLDCVEG